MGLLAPVGGSSDLDSGGHLPGCVSSGLECSCPKASQRYEPPLGSMPGGMDQGDDRTHAEGESRNAPAILVQPPLDNAHLLRAPPFGPGHVSRFDLGPGRNAFMVPPLQPWLPAVSWFDSESIHPPISASLRERHNNWKSCESNHSHHPPRLFRVTAFCQTDAVGAATLPQGSAQLPLGGVVLVGASMHSFGHCTRANGAKELSEKSNAGRGTFAV